MSAALAASSSSTTLRSVDGAANLYAVARQWLGVIAAVALLEAVWHPLLYALAVLWIGSRQHALFALVHEGVHGLLHADRRWNRGLAKVLCAWPILVPYESYRRIHLLHHRYLNTPRDPDWQRNRPDRLGNLSTRSLRALLGLEGAQVRLLDFFVVGERPPGLRLEVRETWARLSFYVLVLGAAAYGGALTVLVKYWLVPLATWFVATMRLKGLAEHYGMDNASPIGSHTIIPTPLEGVLLSPLNFGYHAAHHASPGVPYRALPELHALLMRTEHFRRHAPVTHSYRAFLFERLIHTRRLSRGPTPEVGTQPPC